MLISKNLSLISYLVPRCNENATYKKCPSACPRTCENPIRGVCTKNCLKAGCECDPDYVLNNGRCIKFEDCPDKIYAYRLLLIISNLKLLFFIRRSKF